MVSFSACLLIAEFLLELWQASAGMHAYTYHIRRHNYYILVCDYFDEHFVASASSTATDQCKQDGKTKNPQST